jgi:uncharacterized membrane protein YvbJ
MFCKHCGTQIKEGANFCLNCGQAINIESLKPASIPDGNGANQVQKKSDKIDKAVFYHLGKHIYACYLYKDGIVVGNMTATQATFIPNVKSLLQDSYENITIEIREET